MTATTSTDVIADVAFVPERVDVDDAVSARQLLARDGAVILTGSPVGADAVVRAAATVLGTRVRLRRHDAIVWQLRAPRVLLGAVVGGGLAVAGVALQAMVRNVLADPYILGVTSGASTGAAASILVGVGAALGASSLTGSAFAGALLASMVVLALARSGGKVTSTRLLLAGVAVGYVLSAVASFLIFASDSPEGARSVLFWLLGSLSLARWSTLGVAAAVVLVCFGVLLLWGRRLDALSIATPS